MKRTWEELGWTADEAGLRWMRGDLGRMRAVRADAGRRFEDAATRKTQAI
eukprot:CAMPEP_0174369140 /NCGR_PEP_ID=MMETSP0811_2-20130205/91448_1 /TAXON_ID=73025 ORGANISM="Eutreptiella gymnastica-like, Strain CCMP1594" /NCGR_SAMPLE_ID=MMETSP0811_2 /ASSEMBLY_ACC=CAM_ASM_000667 /LENGTH=49 /DNA_ID=CAMNT_0015513279 /DNA_START=238 /DNA_END=387 /DNA_ORIENTATION=-